MNAKIDSWRGVAAEQVEEGNRGAVSGVLRHRSRLLLGSLLRPHMKGIVVGAILVIVNAAAVMAGPYLVKIAIDSGLRAGQTRTLGIVVVIYGITQVAEALTLRAFLMVTGRNGEQILLDLRERVFDHIESLSVAFHERYTSGRIMSRLTSDIDALSELLSTGLVSLPTAVLSLVGVGVLMFILDRPLALVTLSVFPFVVVLTWWFRHASERIYRRVRDAVALVIIHFAESLGGIRAVHAYRREPRNQAIFEDVNGRYRDANMSSIRASSVFGPGISLLGDIATATVLLYGGSRVLNGQIEVGVLVAFLLYVRQFFAPVQELSQVYNIFQAAAAALEKLSGVLDEPADVPEPSDDVAVVRSDWQGAVRFDGVTFAYRDRPILSDFHLDVPAGQTVALVGATGAGKSTLARLVSRFYDSQQGSVSLDGVDLRHIREADLRRAVIMVTQEGFLFSGTVADNIAFGRPHASRDEIVRAAEVVGAHPFIAAMPDGYDTDVRKRGGRLSAGQKQLVALARAFLADPTVIIFDEATSSLDMPSERLIQQALEIVLRDRTSFIIAHRLATVEVADRVLVIDGGRIVEDGTPAELLGTGGRWAELSKAWTDSLA